MPYMLDWNSAGANGTYGATDGTGGDDTLYGGAGDDRLRGSYDDDALFGGTGDDHIWGGFGDDGFFMEDGFGADAIAGEAITEAVGDTLDLSGVSDDLGIDLRHVSPEMGTFADGSATAEIGEIEHIVSFGGEDTLILGDGPGADIVSGFAAPLDNGAGAGDALLLFEDGFGHDLATGGETGETDGDVMALGKVSGPVDVTFGGDEAGRLSAGANSVEFAEIESVHLGAGDDTVDTRASSLGTGFRAGDGDDIFHGSGGDDAVFGYDGHDSLFGHDGNDALDGGAGDDSIARGARVDTLIGGAGGGRLSGGAGFDQIFGGLGDDTIWLGEGDEAQGDEGDDLFLVAASGDAGANSARASDGAGGETRGDTFGFRGLTHWDDITYANPDPNPGGGMSGFAPLSNGSALSVSEVETDIICFTQGTRIATNRGLRLVEDLRAGDLVVTRDHGLQPVRWAGRRSVPAQGAMAPIRFETGALGNSRPFLVSPQHRMLIEGGGVSMLFGQSEVLVSAKHLVNGGSVARVPGGMADYVHILFDDHEIVYAEGAASESFFPGDTGLDAVEAPAREELFTLFPELRDPAGSYGDTARMCLRRHEARLVRLS